MTDAATEPIVIEETCNGVRVLRLNRPEKKNAFSTEMGWAIVNAVDAAVADDDVRVVAITGVGGAFCSGADITPRRPTDPPPASVDEVVEMGIRLVKGTRLDCHKPVVAGIDGIAIGAGVSLAMCADIRMASSAAKFHPGYARLATSPDAGLTWTLPAAIGHERAMRFLLELKMLDAEAALALGLVGEVAAADGFDEAFLAYCERIAAVAPFAATETKRLVNKLNLPDNLEAHLRDELETTLRGLMSGDGREARRALREKRTPVFTRR